MANPTARADQFYPLQGVYGWDGVTNILANSIADSSMIAGTITNASIAANTIGSTQVAKNLVQLADVTLTPAQIKTLYSVPTQIIATPGVGKSIVVLQALARFTYTTPAYTAGGAVQLQYDSTVHAGGTTPLTTLAAAVLTGTANVDTQLGFANTSVTVAQNKGIFASAATADFATGTVSTLEFLVWYQIV